mmetsp:Transcript_19441/g.38056  ORF Transcript_19441/g.38056 Transcript_19441/m.38056 type:complete len:650 (+) Transcript_19441:173-2122(+)
MHHALDILLHLPKELGTRIIFLPHRPIIFPSLILAGDHHFTAGTCHLKLLAQFSLFVGVIETQAGLEFGNEFFVGEFLSTGFAAGFFLGVADAIAFGLIQLGFALEHALSSLSTGIDFLGGHAPPVTDVQRQNLLHGNRRNILPILHLRLLGHRSRRKMIIREGIESTAQIGKKGFHLLLGGFFFGLFLVTIAIEPRRLFQVFSFVQLPETQFGLFLTDFRSLPFSVPKADVGQLPRNDVVPILLQDASFDHFFDVGGVSGREDGRGFEGHFEFGGGVEEGIGGTFGAFGFSHHLPGFFGHHFSFEEEGLFGEFFGLGGVGGFGSLVVCLVLLLLRLVLVRIGRLFVVVVMMDFVGTSAVALLPIHTISTEIVIVPRIGIIPAINMFIVDEFDGLSILPRSIFVLRRLILLNQLGIRPSKDIRRRHLRCICGIVIFHVEISFVVEISFAVEIVKSFHFVIGTVLFASNLVGLVLFGECVAKASFFVVIVFFLLLLIVMGIVAHSLTNMRKNLFLFLLFLVLLLLAGIFLFLLVHFVLISIRAIAAIVLVLRPFDVLLLLVGPRLHFVQIEEAIAQIFAGGVDKRRMAAIFFFFVFVGIVVGALRDCFVFVFYFFFFFFFFVKILSTSPPPILFLDSPHLQIIIWPARIK